MKNINNSSVPKAKVAVIVPCYNLGQYLGECLESILHQSFTDWVCIVVDDGSRDNTETVAKYYCMQDSRFHYLRQKNSGVASARNNGINFCHSEYILPLDADDYLGDSFLERTVKVVDEDSDVKVVYTNTQLFGTVNHVWNLPDYSFSKLLIRNMIVSTSLFRRGDYVKTPGYDRNLKKWEDWDFWLSLLDPESRVIKLSDLLFFYRQRRGSRNTTGSLKRSNYIKRQIYYKHIEKYRKFHDDPDVLNYRIQIMENEIREYQHSWLFVFWSFTTKTVDSITLSLSALKKYLKGLFGRNKDNR